MTGEEIGVLLLSLKVAAVAMAVSLPFAVGVALALARLNFPGKSIVRGIVQLPLILPPVVTGFFLLILLGHNGLIGAWLYSTFGISFSFRWTGAAIAAGVMGFPLMERAIRLSAEMVDRRLEQAAATLGAGRWRIFTSVTLPLMLPGIVTGVLLSFGRSLGEFGATITFVSNIPGETRTLPLAIYTFTQVPGGDAAALRLVIISVALSLATLVGGEYLNQRATARLHGR
ncbi:MAG TPA: molybdate ABC transporter permease subunit [Stellaceae bacterium]